jgi:hypothetical protein
MFLGFPSFWSVEARIPMRRPADTIPQRDFRNSCNLFISPPFTIRFGSAVLIVLLELAGVTSLRLSR